MFNDLRVCMVCGIIKGVGVKTATWASCPYKDIGKRYGKI